jgi:hypothetical protein
MVWEVVYREDTGTASLNYLSLGIGFVLGLQFCGRVLDMVRSSTISPKQVLTPLQDIYPS